MGTLLLLPGSTDSTSVVHTAMVNVAAPKGYYACFYGGKGPQSFRRRQSPPIHCYCCAHCPHHSLPCQRSHANWTTAPHCTPLPIPNSGSWDSSERLSQSVPAANFANFATCLPQALEEDGYRNGSFKVEDGTHLWLVLWYRENIYLNYSS